MMLFYYTLEIIYFKYTLKKTRSNEAEDAGIHNIFLANMASVGKNFS